MLNRIIMYLLICTFLLPISSCNLASSILAKQIRPVVTPPPEFYKIFITHEVGGIYSLRLNYATGAVDQVQSVNINSVLGAPLINPTNRGLFVNGSQTLMLAHHTTRTVGFMKADLSAAPTSQILFDAGGLTGFFGLCQLPNGNFIAGSDQWSGSKANEYSSAGTLQRSFNSTQQWTFSDCVAVSNTRVIWIDYDASSDLNGDLVVSELSSGSWAEVARYVTNTQLSGLVDSMWYSLVLHSDGNIYAFPFTGGPTRNKKVLKCSASGNFSDCQLIGSDLTTNFASISVIQGLSQLAGRDEIAFVCDDRFLYLFNPLNNAVVRKADLNTVLPLSNNFEIRGFKVIGL